MYGITVRAATRRSKPRGGGRSRVVCVRRGQGFGDVRVRGVRGDVRGGVRRSDRGVPGGDVRGSDRGVRRSDRGVRGGGVRGRRDVRGRHVGGRDQRGDQTPFVSVGVGLGR